VNKFRFKDASHHHSRIKLLSEQIFTPALVAVSNVSVTKTTSTFPET